MSRFGLAPVLLATYFWHVQLRSENVTERLKVIVFK